MADLDHLALVDRLTDAFAVEIGRHDPAASVAWPWWPDVRALIGHLGGIHAWAAEVVMTGRAVPDPEDRPAPADAVGWYRDRRALLLDALRSTPPERSCWVFTGADRSCAFWRRRMVFETAKHLVDLRASGSGEQVAPPELDAATAADGIDELLDVFLARSRPDLARLPAPVRLEAVDIDRTWLVSPDWAVTDGEDADAARLRATAADLALFVWDRADPLDDPRFALTGPREAVAALRDAAVHP